MNALPRRQFLQISGGLVVSFALAPAAPALAQLTPAAGKSVAADGVESFLAVAPDGPSWSLLPIAKDVGSFGLAIVRLDEPPRVDEPVVWSMYPNGLDPAPIAAASGGGSAPRGSEVFGER